MFQKVGERERARDREHGPTGEMDHRYGPNNRNNIHTLECGHVTLQGDITCDNSSGQAHPHKREPETKCFVTTTIR